MDPYQIQAKVCATICLTLITAASSDANSHSIVLPARSGTGWLLNTLRVHAPRWTEHAAQ